MNDKDVPSSPAPFRGALQVALLMAVGLASADPLPVAIGTPVGLRFVHHVSSARDPVGTPVFARVSHDVRRFGRTVVRAGELIEGTVTEVSAARVAGLPGAFVVVFRDVAAVDGTRLPLDARVIAQGKDNVTAAGIMASLVLIPGPSGSSPVITKGTLVNAQLAATVTIDPDLAKPPVTPDRIPVVDTSVAPESFGTVSLGASSSSTGGVLKVRAETPAGLSADGLKLVLLSVNDERLPEFVTATSADKDRGHVFSTWEIARHCELGDNRLLFGWIGPHHGVVSARNEIGVRFELKGRR